MTSYVPMTKDPYADFLRPSPPRDRRRHPLDPSEPYVLRFTTAPIRQNPRTGSYDYRHGLLNDESISAKERRFEDYVNEQQARRDELSDLKEWRRLKDLEEEAIALYHDLGENLEEFTTQMRTRDQMEMELQCGRNKQIEKDLTVNAQRALAAACSIPFAMEQERIKIARASIQANFKAGVEASMANTKVSTHATGSQQTSQQSELTRSKPKKHDNTSQPVSSTEAGLPREQQEKIKPSPEEICDQLQGQVPNQNQSPSATIDQSICSGTYVGVGSSKQQEEKKQPSTEEIRRQFVEQGRKIAAEAGLSMHKERKTEPRPQRFRSNSQARMRAFSAAPTNVGPAPPQSAASAPVGCPRDGNISPRPDCSRPKDAEYQRMRIDTGVHYLQGGVLVSKEPGLTKLHLGSSSKAEQSLSHITHQAPDTSRENRVIRFTERSSKSTFRHQSSSSTSPDKSSDRISPEKSSDSTPPNESSDSKSPEHSSTSTSPYQVPDAEYEPTLSAEPPPTRAPVPQTTPVTGASVPQAVPVYDPSQIRGGPLELEWSQLGSVRSDIRKNRLRFAMYDDPEINAMFCRKIEEMKKDGLARKQRLAERQRLRRCNCEGLEHDWKQKLARERDWEELNEFCRKTSRPVGMSPQKCMSSQELIEFCRKTCSQGETSQQEGSSSQEVATGGTSAEQQLDARPEEASGPAVRRY